jgi:hypothetical protein
MNSHSGWRYLVYAGIPVPCSYSAPNSLIDLLELITLYSASPSRITFSMHLEPRPWQTRKVS